MSKNLGEKLDILLDLVKQNHTSVEISITLHDKENDRIKIVSEETTKQLVDIKNVTGTNPILLVFDRMVEKMIHDIDPKLLLDKPTVEDFMKK